MYTTSNASWYRTPLSHTDAARDQLLLLTFRYDDQLASTSSTAIIETNLTRRGVANSTQRLLFSGEEFNETLPLKFI